MFGTCSALTCRLMTFKLELARDISLPTSSSLVIILFALKASRILRIK